MNFKTTGLLLVFLAAVLGLSWLSGVFSTAPAESQVKAPPVVDAGGIFLIAPQLRDLTKVELEVADSGRVVFERDGQGWMITDPVSVRPLEWHLTNLVSMFREARKLETFVPGQKHFETLTLKDAGLDEPMYRVTFHERDRTLSFLVGRNVVASENTYVKTPDSDEVIIVDQNLRTRVSRDLTDYRNRQLLAFDKNNVGELTFSDRDGKQIVFVRDSQEQWRMLAPFQASASSETIDGVLGGLVSLLAQDFVDDAPTELESFGLDAPVWTVRIVETATLVPATQGDEDEPGEPEIRRTEHVLLVGNATGLQFDQVFVKRADKDWVVTVAEENIARVIPDLQAWRDKRILNLSRAHINRVEIDRGVHRVNLVKSDPIWMLDMEEETVVADPRRVHQVLECLVGLQAVSFIDQPDSQFLQKNRLEQPLATVRVFAAGLDESIELLLGQTTPSGLFRYVKARGTDYVAAVSEESLEPLMHPTLDYYNKQMVAFNIDKVTAVEVVRDQKTYRVERANLNESWKVVSPIEAQADQESVHRILFATFMLQAREYVGRGVSGRHGLHRPLVQVTLTTEETGGAADTRKSYALAATSMSGKIYAARTDVDDALVGLVSEDLLADLTAELIDRKVFVSGPAEPIDRVEFRRFNRDPVIFEKQDDGWKFPPDPVYAVDPEKLEKLIVNLTGLKALRYADLESVEGYNLQRPHLEILISAGEETWSLTVGQAVDDKEDRFALASERSWVFVLSAEDLKKLDLSLKDLAFDPSSRAAPKEDEISLEDFYSIMEQLQ